MNALFFGTESSKQSIEDVSQEKAGGATIRSLFHQLIFKRPDRSAPMEFKPYVHTIAHAIITPSIPIPGKSDPHPAAAASDSVQLPSILFYAQLNEKIDESIDKIDQLLTDCAPFESPRSSAIFTDTQRAQDTAQRAQYALQNHLISSEITKSKLQYHIAQIQGLLFLKVVEVWKTVLDNSEIQLNQNPLITTCYEAVIKLTGMQSVFEKMWSEIHEINRCEKWPIELLSDIKKYGPEQYARIRELKHLAADLFLNEFFHLVDQPDCDSNRLEEALDLSDHMVKQFKELGDPLDSSLIDQLTKAITQLPKVHEVGYFIHLSSAPQTPAAG